MASETNFTRRQFLNTASVTAGSFLVAYYAPPILTGPQRAFAAEPKPVPSPALNPPPNAFIEIAKDNSVTITINKLEMGQGVNTSLAQLIAEELDCDFKNLKSVSASVNPVYNNTLMPLQMTGGSNALHSSWDQHRMIGARMREMLKSAAALKWGVPVSTLETKNGFVLLKSKGKISYGELAEAASRLPMPETATLKDPKQFRLIGTSAIRVDAPSKVDGTALYGLDVRLPGMLYAAMARPPLPGALPKSFREESARAVRGVIDVVKLKDRVAVVAKNSFAALKGRDALEVQWNQKNLSEISDKGLMTEFRAKGVATGLIAESRGESPVKMAGAKTKKILEYEFPFLAHAPMEPMNCTIHYDGNKAEIWAGHQMPGIDQVAAAKVLGLKPSDVKVNTTYAGGSFGRRASKTSDYVVEAAELAKKIKKPIKVVWSREDDTRGGFYRPMNFHRVELGFDDKNQLAAWRHHIVGQSIMEGTFMESAAVQNEIEKAVVEGVAQSPYELQDFQVEQTRMPTPLTTLWWRSVGHTHTAYAMETAIDEIAETAGQDPMQLRRQMLKKSPRHIGVLDQLQKMSGWGRKKPPKGRAWGLAIHQSFGSVVGQIAEVSIANGRPKVHRVWASAHVGRVVNPEVARTQVEGAIVFGLSAALDQAIRIEKGIIQSGNFADYPILRMNEMPKVEVGFVPSEDKPTGLGEPGVPPIGPAVANAIYKLTGQRMRALPFSQTTLTLPKV